MLLDRYVGAEHGGQRSGRAAARITRPLFAADAADMPFADGVFDYVVCSHVLEHVPDPAAVIGEITRVGRAGYIEVPAGGERQDPRLPEPPVVVSARRVDARVHRQARPGVRSRDRRLHRAVRRRARAREAARPGVRLPDRVACAGTRTSTSGSRARSTRCSRRRHARPRPTTAPGRRSAAGCSRRRWRSPTGATGAARPVLFDDVVKPELRTGTGERLQKRLYAPAEQARRRSSRTPASSWRRRRDRRRRSRRRRRRARRTPSPAGGRGACASSAPCSPAAPPGTGSTRRPSSVSAMSAPVLASSPARSPSRSLSLARMNPTPRIVVGVDAVAATAAIVGTRSDVAAMSTSMPRSGRPRVPRDRDGALIGRRRRSPSPRAGRRSAMSPCAEAVVSPATVTAPPRTAATASG